MSIADITQWIDLYNWWRRSRQSKRAFIAENRAELTACIERVINGSKPAHYLAYGGGR